MNSRHKIILDSDFGVDDAMALYFALAHPDIELLGITTTFGNVSTAQAVRNATYLCALAGRSIPVCEGVHTPTRKTPVTPDFTTHGVDGLGNLPQRSAKGYEPDKRSAARFIVDLAHAHPGEVNVVAIGPLGNLSQALRLEPHLPALLRGLIVMGGTIAEPGSVSPVAEANVWHDPHAADTVCGTAWPLTLVGLDVTQQMVMPVSLFEKIATHQQHVATDTLLHAVRFYAAFFAGLYPALARSQACFGHDVLAMIYLVHPELFGTELGRVRVVTDGLAVGQTIMDRREFLHYPQPGWGEAMPRLRACMQVDAAACLRLFEDTLMRDWLPT